MTKMQVEGDHVGATTPKFVASGEGADRCGGPGAWRGRFRGRSVGWDP